jgi:hypothetical protein
MKLIQPMIKTGILIVGVAHFEHKGVHYVSADSKKWRATTNLDKLSGANMARYLGMTTPAKLPTDVTIILNKHVTDLAFAA